MKKVKLAAITILGFHVFIAVIGHVKMSDLDGYSFSVRRVYCERVEKGMSLIGLPYIGGFQSSMSSLFGFRDISEEQVKACKVWANK